MAKKDRIVDIMLIDGVGIIETPGVATEYHEEYPIILRDGDGLELNFTKYTGKLKLSLEKGIVVNFVQRKVSYQI